MYTLRGYVLKRKSQYNAHAVEILFPYLYPALFMILFVQASVIDAFFHMEQCPTVLEFISNFQFINISFKTTVKMTTCLNEIFFVFFFSLNIVYFINGTINQINACVYLLIVQTNTYGVCVYVFHVELLYMSFISFQRTFHIRTHVHILYICTSF